MKENKNLYDKTWPTRDQEKYTPLQECLRSLLYFPSYAIKFVGVGISRVVKFPYKLKTTSAQE